MSPEALKEVARKRVGQALVELAIPSYRDGQVAHGDGQPLHYFSSEAIEEMVKHQMTIISAIC